MRISDWSSDVCSSDLTTRDSIRHSGEGYSNVIIIDNVQRIEGTWAGGQRSGSFTWIVITQTAQFKPGENGALEVDINDWDYINEMREAPTASYFYRSEEHTSELQSLMRISYAVFCLTKNIHHIKD